jgi:hypothetical protein
MARFTGPVEVLRTGISEPFMRIMARQTVHWSIARARLDKAWAHLHAIGVRDNIDRIFAVIPFRKIERDVVVESLGRPEIVRSATVSEYRNRRMEMALLANVETTIQGEVLWIHDSRIDRAYRLR